MKIIYEDAHLLVAVKPAGIPTQPVPTNPSEMSCESCLKQFIKERDKKPAGVFLHAIFRIDRPVSGLVLFAKSSKALSRLEKMQREHAYIKEYVALVCLEQGVAAPTPGLLVDSLIRGEYRAIVEKGPTSEGKIATTEIVAVEPLQYGFYKLLLRLHTGRYHQIRAQLAARNWPILGDERYGGRPYGTLFSQSAIALHHRALSFYHPVAAAQEPKKLACTNDPGWLL